MDGTDPRLISYEGMRRFLMRDLVERGPDWVLDRGRDGVQAVASAREHVGLWPNAFSNRVVWIDPAAEVVPLVESVCAEFDASGLPWTWEESPVDGPPEVGVRLAELGLAREASPVMHRSLAALPDVAAPADLGAEIVSDVLDGELVRTMCEVFEFPAEDEDVFLEVLAAVRRPKDAYAAAVVDGAVIGTAQGFVHGDVVFVVNVTTLPDHRGRGIGSALTLSVLAAARDRGCRQAALVSSPLGHGVYRGLGFADIGEQVSWVRVPEGWAEDEQP